MTEQAENTKRIAKNTLMLYVRMLFGMLVSLYTSRVVLQALGVEDYGIYNVVGGVVAMFSIISNSLSSSVSRFLTFELGKGNMEGLKRVFSTSLTIQVVLAVMIVLLSETIGLWFLDTHMNIPINRLYAAKWVFHASVFTFVISLLSVPFSASIVSHEKMSAFAYIGILDIILRLLIVLFIAYSGLEFDRLIVYALLLVGVVCIMQAIYWNYCTRHFEECKFRLSFDSGYWKEMSSFAGWNFIGGSASLLKDQGVNILLNLFIGPVINAARGIANTVNNVLASFASNFMKKASMKYGLLTLAGVLLTVFCYMGYMRQSAETVFAVFPLLAVGITPILGNYVDHKGKAASMLMIGSMLLVLCHLTFAFVLPEFRNNAVGGVVIAYLTILVLGASFSLVPASLWPSVPKLVDAKIIGSAYALIFWVQNIGLWLFPLLIGKVLDKTNTQLVADLKNGVITPEEAAVSYDYTAPLVMLACLGVAALVLGFILKVVDKKKGLGLEEPNIKA